MRLFRKFTKLSWSDCHWRIQPSAMGGILRQRKLHWRIQRPDFCRSGPNLPQFSTFSPDLLHFIFKLQNFGIFYFDDLIFMFFLVR